MLKMHINHNDGCLCSNVNHIVSRGVISYEEIFIHNQIFNRVCAYACTICVLTRILPFVGSMNNSGTAHVFGLRCLEESDVLALGLLITCSNASLEIHPAII